MDLAAEARNSVEKKKKEETQLKVQQLEKKRKKQTEEKACAEAEHAAKEQVE